MSHTLKKMVFLSSYSIYQVLEVSGNSVTSFYSPNYLFPSYIQAILISVPPIAANLYIAKISKIQIKWINKEGGRLVFDSSIFSLAELLIALLFILTNKFSTSNEIYTSLDSIQ